jgi:hypothetical protein
VIADVPDKGNPNDDALLGDAIAKAKQAGMRVDCVLADRGLATDGARGRRAAWQTSVTRSYRGGDGPRGWRPRARGH